MKPVRYFFCLFLLLQPMLIMAQGRNNNLTAQGAATDTPKLKFSICSFALPGAAIEGAGYGDGFNSIYWTVYEAPENPALYPYYHRLKSELRTITENVLDSAFSLLRYVPRKGLDLPQSGKMPNMEVVAKKNGLTLCLTVVTTTYPDVGWKKRIVMSTYWRITSASGQVHKIHVSVDSESKEAVMPDVWDPKREPLMMDLQIASARGFVVEFAKFLKTKKGQEFLK